jgi:hypothetical protein
VNLPHESLVWLQPLATLIAGAFVLAAAVIAYRAVTRQIAANAQAVQDQIDAAAAQQQKNRDAEWARLRRQEVLDLLEEAGRMARKLANAATTYSLVAENPALFDSPDDQRRQEMQDWEFPEITANTSIVVDRLKLHGLTTVSGPLVLLEIEAGAVIQGLDYGEWTIPDKEQAVFDAIKDALQKPLSSRSSPGPPQTGTGQTF